MVDDGDRQAFSAFLNKACSASGAFDPGTEPCLTVNTMKFYILM
jgi:hypothetical protein